MDKRQRIAMQRGLVREAIGKLRAAEELFSVEDNAIAENSPGFEEFCDKVDALEVWIFEASAIA
jgi:hypothetical protein